MKLIQVDVKNLRLLCDSLHSNQEVATALGISSNCVRTLCIREGVESPFNRKNRLIKEKKSGKRAVDNVPDPRFEGYGADRQSRTPTPEETAARIALQPPLRRIDPSMYSSPPIPDVIQSYREKHHDMVGKSR